MKMPDNKILVFDSSTLISLSNVCLLSVLRKVKENSKVRFVIGPEVKKEVVDDALRGNRFKFSGMRIMKLIKDNVIEVIGNSMVKKDSLDMMNLANRVYSTRKSYVKILHSGEMESMALMKFLGTDAFAVDERILRLFIESPEELKELLSRRLKTKITFDRGVYKKFISGRKVRIMRSAEVAAIGYDLGVFKPYKDVVFRGQSEVVKGFLWALKMSGCAISEKGIDAYIKELVGR
jgi:predicted nucleic acid-binding protein